MRLVTRADFDGLVCGALITKFEQVDSYLFVEPKFMQDGQVDIRAGDIIANLPYNRNCTLWFDHHITNTMPEFDQPIMLRKGGFRLAPSAARVVYEYYTELGKRFRTGGVEQREQPSAFPADQILPFLNTDRMVDLLQDADKVDAGQLTREDVLNPKDYVLLSMTTDGRYAEDEPYWRNVIDLLRDQPLEKIMKEPEVARRCRKVLDFQEKLRKILLERTTMKKNVIYVDLRGIKDIPDGNRFLLFTLFPDGNISVKVNYDTQRENTTAISVGYNIFNKTATINVGELLNRYGGGGHKVVGSCRVPNDKAEQAIKEIVAAVTE
ncbi:MAG: exopolyphosphatase [Deltaproteobacteria bacterium]|nr:exopolyphosphatase [Deltaproteobacteria bacterium]